MKPSVAATPLITILVAMHSKVIHSFRSHTVRARIHNSYSWRLFSSNDHAVREEKQRILSLNSKLQLAPMMDYTDRHFRHVVRLISNHTLLYTEMVAANALTHEYQDYIERQRTDDWYLKRLLQQSSHEGPSVLQLGGSDPNQMYVAAKAVLEMTERGDVCDYTAINLNCGCPSPKVANKGCFGAALMDEPALVSDLVQALHEGCQGRFPITVKCRIGTDSKFSHQDGSPETVEAQYNDLRRFIERVAANGVVTDFGIHARIAVLQKSFSPADNRKIPPLRYELVRRLIDDYKELQFTLNGGIESVPQVQEQLEACPRLQGVMIGRAWAADPWSFCLADSILYGKECPTRNRLDVLRAYGKYADAQEEEFDAAKIRRFLIKAITQLFTGEPNSKRYRMALDEIACLLKKPKEQQPTLPLSELIMNAAIENLSEETVLRTPQESYERSLYLSQKNKSGRLVSVAKWQRERKEEELSSGNGDYLLRAQQSMQ